MPAPDPARELVVFWLGRHGLTPEDLAPLDMPRLQVMQRVVRLSLPELERLLVFTEGLTPG